MYKSKKVFNFNELKLVFIFVSDTCIKSDEKYYYYGFFN